MEKAKKVLKQYIKKGENIAVAVSGGQDSMALLHYVWSLKDELDCNVFAVNVNHNLRGKNSSRDSRFVKEFCAENDIKFLGSSIDVPAIMQSEGISAELAARKARFEVFADLKSKGKADKLLLAHHQSDQAETVLLHMLYGCGISGAKGMVVLRNNYYLRPFLYTEHQAILQYTKDNDIPFVMDETNALDDYDRNYLRNRIFPMFRPEWKAEKQFASFAERARIDDEFINSYVKNPIISGDEVMLEADVLKAHFSIVSRYIRRGLEMMEALFDVSYKHIESIVNLKDKQSGKYITLPNNIFAYKDYKGVVLTRERQERSDQKIRFTGEGEYVLGDNKIKVSLWKDAFQKGGLYIDADKIPAGSVFRFRIDGDTFVKFGGGRRKLKEYLIDIKVPSRNRSSIPLLAVADEILAVIGYEISDELKIDATTKRIFRLELK